MKKVLKKFNRTLSIMLAAAMVLTMVPQTAMPVLAAENEVVEEASEASEVTDVTPADEDNESADVKDADDTDISGDSDTTDDEQNENEGDETGDNSDDNTTPDIENPDGDQNESDDPEGGDSDANQPADDPEVTTPVEPEEPEADAGEEELPGPGIMAAGEATAYTVTTKVIKDDTEDSSLASVTFTDGSLDGDKVKAETDIAFKVNLTADEIKLAESDAVTATVAKDGSSTSLTVTEVDGIYTIANTADSPIEGDVEITVNVVDKTYSVSVPTDGAAHGVTWTIKGGSLTDFAAGPAPVKKSDTITVQAALAANADPLKVGLQAAGAAKKDLTSAAPVTFEIAVSSLTFDENGAVTLGADYEETKVSAQVTVKGAADITFGTDISAKYSTANAKGDFAEWKDVPANGIITDASVKDTIGFKFTATDKDNKARTIDKVMFGAADSTTEAATSTDDKTGETIYEVTVAAPVADPANNIVTVSLKETNVISIKKADNAKIKTVAYKASDDSDFKKAVTTTDGWKVETTNSAVTFRVTAEDHNKVTYIHKGTGAHAAECANDMVFGETATTVTTTDSIDASAAGETLTIGTEQITVDYVLDAPEDENVKVAIQKADGTAVAAKGTTGDDAKTYVLNDGETYYIKVTDAENKELALEKIDNVEVDETTLSYNSSKKAFYFMASEASGISNHTIEVALVAAQGHAVTVIMDDELSAGDDFLATIKADEYQKSATATDKQPADAAAKDIKADDDGNNVSYASVWEGTDFSFVLAAKDAENYKVTKVQTSTNGRTWDDLNEENGKYTIKAINAATTVKVTTALDTEKAYSIKFTGDAADISNVEMDLAGGTSPAGEATLDEVNYLKKTAGAKVTFKVTAKDGYTVDKVAYGTAEGETLTADGSGVYTYDKFSDTAKAATITISTKASALTDGDRLVKFDVMDDNVKLDVTSPANIKPDDKGVYTLTQAKAAEGTNPAVEEISELAFNLTVPYGYTFDKTTFLSVNSAARATAEKRVKSEDGNSWIYSFKVVANQLTASQTNTITVAKSNATKENVTLALAEGSEQPQYKELDEYGSGSWGELVDETVVTGRSTVILQVKDGQTLKVGGKDVTEELDGDMKYSFVADLDDTKDNESTIEINVQGAVSYEINYEIEPENASPDYTPAYDETAGKDAVEAKIGNKVHVQLYSVEDDVVAEISKYELSENAKSTVKVAEDKNSAVITVAGADSVKLYTVATKQVGKFYVETEVLAGTISFNAKDAAGKTLTAKGIKKNATLKLDATSVTSYALTLKDGKNTLNAADYAESLVVKNSDETVAKVGITGDTLSVKTLKGEKATAEISIYAKGAEDTALLTFKVEGQTPKLKVKSVNSNNQGMNDILVDLAADGSVKPVSDQFKLYYEVAVTEGESATAKTYYLNAKDAGNGKAVPVSQLFKVNSDAPATAVEKEYTFTVRLVAVAAATTVVEGAPQTGTAGTALAAASVAFASDQNVVKKFKTRPAYYEDKLGVTKKTTKFYSGQQNVTVAIPKFSKKAGYINDVQAVVYNKDGSRAVGVWAEEVDLNTMEVKVSTYNYQEDEEITPAGNYDVVIYATAQTATVDGEEEYTMYRASAKVPITVQKGINRITVDYPSQIAQVADKNGKRKDVSITLKPVGVYDYVKSALIKAQSQKFTYTLLKEGVDEVYDTRYLGNPKNADQIVVKNNKITVKKDFIIGHDPSDNYFTVLVKAADYSENEASFKVKITVTGEALEIASVKLVDNVTGKALPQTMTTREIQGASVSLTDKNGKEINSSLVTLTPNKGKIYVTDDLKTGNASIRMDAYQNNLTIKAVAKDGGKKNKSSVKYTINYPTGVSYSIDLGKNNSKYQQTGDHSYSYMSTGSDTISFSVKAAIGEESPTAAKTSLYNYSVKVEGGKVTSSKDSISWGSYSITPSKETVKVTIIDKTKKGDKGVSYTFNARGWQTAAAPKASTKNKLYAAKDAVTGKDITQEMIYTVAKNNGYNAVRLTYNSGDCVKDVGGLYDIDGNNTFTLHVSADKAGSEKYSAVYGNKVDGAFYPKTKATTITIKAAKTGNIKAVAKYTINPNVAMGVKLEAKPVPVAGMVRYNKVVSANVSGKANQFYDYFEVGKNPDGTSNGMLQIRADKRTADGLAAVAALPKSDLTGYLEYQFSNANGDIITKEDKITVTISDKAVPKYTASAVNIVATNNASAATVIKLGSSTVDIAKVAVGENIADAWKASIANATDGAEGKITLTAVGEPKAGNVDLYVIPTASKNTAVTADADIRNAGVKVTVKVTVKAADDTKAKLGFAKGSKTPEASINTNKVDLTVALVEGKDFTYNLSNEMITTAVKTDAANITNANDKKAAEAVNTVTFTKGADGEKDTLTIVLDRDKLDGNKVYKVPADLTFTSGTKATVTFSVKTEKIPTMAQVKTLVENALKDFSVSSANYNNATAAAAEVKKAADDIDIPALSGIQVTAVAASDPTKFADSGTGETAVAGDHKIKVTLTDVTKAADATDKTADVEITVKKGAAAQTLVSVLKAAITGYAVPGADGKVAEGKTAVPTTRWALQTALQKVVDDFEKDKYTVKVTQFTPTYTSAASGTNSASVLADDAAGTLTSISYDYTVSESRTGNPVDTVGNSSTVTATGGSWNGTAEVTPPEPEEPTVTSVAITAEGAGDNGSVEVEQGGTVTFTAMVTGSDNKPMTEITADKVEWQVEGAINNTDTKIEKDGSNPLGATLTVASNETGNSSKLTVKVTVDNVASNTVEVTVKTTSTPETPDSGNEESGT